MFNRLLLILLAALALAGCSAPPAEVKPALWLVEGPKGEKAWLFGTIHALPEPVSWKSAKVGEAMQGADLLVLEVAAILSSERTEESFARLAQSPNLPRLVDRVPADLRDELARELHDSGHRAGDLDHYETWAAVLMFQQAAGERAEAHAENGIDRAVAKAWKGRIDELEGAATQFRIFDNLPEPQQRALLYATLREGPDLPQKLEKLQKAWAGGDVDQIAWFTDEDFAGQPELRDALLTRRNLLWLQRLEALMDGGAKPFVAVGAAHLAGNDGLPALLAMEGYKVTRLQ